jgi:hypothetical protein
VYVEEQQARVGVVLDQPGSTAPLVASLGSTSQRGSAIEGMSIRDGFPSADDEVARGGPRGGEDGGGVGGGAPVVVMSASKHLDQACDGGAPGKASSCADFTHDSPGTVQPLPLRCRGDNVATTGHVAGHGGASVTVFGSSFGPGSPTQPGAQNPWVFTPPVASSPPGVAPPVIREGSR